MNTETNWIPGLIVLAVGVVGAVLYLLLGKKPPAGGPAPGSMDDLNARYAALLDQLRTHIANKHLLPPETFEAEKKRLELAAAAVLRERDGLTHAAAKAEARAEKAGKAAAAPPAGAFARSPALKGVAIGVVAVGFFVLVGWQLSETATPREDGMSATGGSPPGGGPMQRPPVAVEDPKLKALVDAVQRSPEDVDALAALALHLMRGQAFEQARPFVMQASLIDPFHVKTRVARTVLTASGDNLPQVEYELEKLADYYPEAWDARMFAGLIANELNDPARALRQLELYLAAAPIDEQPPTIAMGVAQLREQIRQGLKTPP